MPQGPHAPRAACPWARKPQGQHGPSPAWPKARMPQHPSAPRPACPKAHMAHGQHGIWRACPKARLPQVSMSRAHLFTFRTPSSVCASFHQSPHAHERDSPTPRAPLRARLKARMPKETFFFARVSRPMRNTGRAPKFCMLLFPCAIPISPKFPMARILLAHKFGCPEIRMQSTP